jgi:hypothetical protein
MSLKKPTKAERCLSWMLRHSSGLSLIEAMEPENGINCSSYNQRVNDLRREDGWPIYPKEENNAGDGNHARHFMDYSTLARLSGISEPEVMRLGWTLQAGDPLMKSVEAYVEFLKANGRKEEEGGPVQCGLFNDPFGRLELKRNQGRT